MGPRPSLQGSPGDRGRPRTGTPHCEPRLLVWGLGGFCACKPLLSSELRLLAWRRFFPFLAEPTRRDSCLSSIYKSSTFACIEVPCSQLTASSSLNLKRLIRTNLALELLLQLYREGGKGKPLEEAEKEQHSRKGPQSESRRLLNPLYGLSRGSAPCTAHP